MPAKSDMLHTQYLPVATPRAHRESWPSSSCHHNTTSGPYAPPLEDDRGADLLTSTATVTHSFWKAKHHHTPTTTPQHQAATEGAVSPSQPKPGQHTNIQAERGATTATYTRRRLAALRHSLERMEHPTPHASLYVCLRHDPPVEVQPTQVLQAFLLLVLLLQCRKPGRLGFGSTTERERRSITTTPEYRLRAGAGCGHAVPVRRRA